jgi:hypothetical protein
MDAQHFLCIELISGYFARKYRQNPACMYLVISCLFSASSLSFNLAISGERMRRRYDLGAS